MPATRPLLGRVASAGHGLVVLLALTMWVLNMSSYTKAPSKRSSGEGDGNGAATPPPAPHIAARRDCGAISCVRGTLKALNVQPDRGFATKSSPLAIRAVLQSAMLADTHINASKTRVFVNATV
mgnify:CR=1 FL=1